MENHNHIVDANYHSYPIFKFFIGLICLVNGAASILLSLNMIEHFNIRPNQTTIFNDPHTWQFFALGMTLFLFGVGNVLPEGMKLLGKINNCLLLVSFLAVVLGIILQKMGQL
jgi:hypothetical protein